MKRHEQHVKAARKVADAVSCCDVSKQGNKQTKNRERNNKQDDIASVLEAKRAQQGPRLVSTVKLQS